VCVGAFEACTWDGGRGGEKPGIKHQTSAVGCVFGVLLALDFNGDEVLCIFFSGYIMVGGTQWRTFS
jgi:hypothetical protein